MVPDAGDYLRARRARQRAGARAQRRGHRARVERLPPPPGDHAEGRGNAPQHRVPAAPLDLRPQGRAARRAAFPREALPGPAPHAAAALERHAVQRPARRRAATSRGSATRRSTSRATCSTRSRSHEYDFNWKTFIEVYLEDYHVGPFHPGPRPVRHLRRPHWEFGDWTSCRPSASTRARQARTRPTRLAQRGARLYRGEPPPHGAIWLTYYPNVMVEWYPHVLVISTLIPQGRDKTLNVVEFYYPEEIALFEREFVEAQQAAYHETANRGRGDRRAHGRRAARAARAGAQEDGPYQSPMEDGMVHFHEFIAARWRHTSATCSGRPSSISGGRGREPCRLAAICLGRARFHGPAPFTSGSCLHAPNRSTCGPCARSVRAACRRCRGAGFVDGGDERGHALGSVHQVPARQRPRGDPRAGQAAADRRGQRLVPRRRRPTRSRDAPASRTCSST